MGWIWQQSDWPNFRYDKRLLEYRDDEFRINSERLTGCFEALPMAYQEDATIDLMLSEAIKTSATRLFCVGYTARSLANADRERALRTGKGSL